MKTVALYLLVVNAADEETIFGIEDDAAEGTNDETVFAVESADVLRKLDDTFSTPIVLDVNSKAGCVEDSTKVVKI
jgi:hypothetical protein